MRAGGLTRVFEALEEKGECFQGEAHGGDRQLTRWINNY